MKWILLVIYPFCSLFMVVGIWTSFATIKSILKARSVRGWPSTSARVVECELERDFDSDGDSFEVLVQYEY